MLKNKTPIIIILLALLTTAILVKVKNWREPKEVPTPPEMIREEEKVEDVLEPNKIVTVNSILEGANEVAQWQIDEYSEGTILWRTAEDELKLNGTGFLFSAEFGSKDLKMKYGSLMVYLIDAGFERDEYNVGSSPPGAERSILKFNNIGCELYIRDDEQKGGTDMGILCTELPEEVTGIEIDPMSEKIARSIAETSDCVVDGTLKEEAFYNENSKTWWIDLNIDKPGCNPACVIHEDETTEINWRCTGLIQE